MKHCVIVGSADIIQSEQTWNCCKSPHKGLTTVPSVSIQFAKMELGLLLVFHKERDTKQGNQNNGIDSITCGMKNIRIKNPQKG